MDKRELKQKVAVELQALFGSNVRTYYAFENTNREIRDLIDQLDEPREFDRVLLKHIHDIYDQYGYDYLPGFINDIKDGLAKLKESEKPVIPQFVADLIEECKKENVSAFLAYSRARTFNYPSKGWIMSNHDLFTRAWLDGYEVEKEKKWIVKLGNAYIRTDAKISLDKAKAHRYNNKLYAERRADNVGGVVEEVEELEE